MKPQSIDTLRDRWALMGGTRVFRSLPQAVIAYAAERLRRESPPAQDLSADSHGSRVPDSTYEALTRCMAPVDPADEAHGEALVSWWPGRKPRRGVDPTREAERRVRELAEWYLCSVEPSVGRPRSSGLTNAQVSLADRRGMSAEALSMVHAYAARVLRRRMEARGLLEVRDAQCAVAR